MPKMNVESSILIDAAPEKIYAIISNLHQWKEWSPWVLAEPDAQIDVSEDGKHHSWDGKIIGSGKLTITEEKINERVVMDLCFLKPWKSQAKTLFVLEPKKEKTKVSWKMKSKLPLFLFWMKTQMETFVRMDYDRGLTLLKDLVETGSTNSILDFKGSVKFEASPYIGIETQCAFSTLGAHMERDFTQLMQYIMSLPEEYRCHGKGISIYKKINLVRDQCTYIAAYTLARVPDKIPTPFVSGNLPEFSAYTIRHTGPYRHIGNAWSAGMMHQRNKVFVSHKKIHPMEIMHNSPTNTAENDLISDILFPEK